MRYNEKQDEMNASPEYSAKSSFRWKNTQYIDKQQLRNSADLETTLIEELRGWSGGAAVGHVCMPYTYLHMPCMWLT